MHYIRRHIRKKLSNTVSGSMVNLAHGSIILVSLSSLQILITNFHLPKKKSQPSKLTDSWHSDFSTYRYRKTFPRDFKSQSQLTMWLFLPFTAPQCCCSSQSQTLWPVYIPNLSSTSACPVKFTYYQCASQKEDSELYSQAPTIGKWTLLKAVHIHSQLISLRKLKIPLIPNIEAECKEGWCWRD